MLNRKEQEKFVYEPGTKEIFRCLWQMTDYSKILLENGPNKPYRDFLKWLLEVNFYIETEEKISIKRLETDFKCDTIRVTKWIKEIYNDICELNFDKPELFQQYGI